MAASGRPPYRTGHGMKLALKSSLLSSLLLVAGCADGPMFQMKKLSPWHRREVARDRALGTTYTQRLDELALLDQQITRYPPDQQQQWAEQLETIVTKDTSPEMRARAARVIAKVDSEATLRALNKASTDEIEKVRLAICDAWAIRKNDQARDMLLSLAATDDSDDVRQAAIRSLASFDSPEVRSQMAAALEHKNPAIQQQAVVSLRKITGRDFGGDFDAWKRYLDGEEVPDPKPASFTARIWQTLPMTR